MNFSGADLGPYKATFCVESDDIVKKIDTFLEDLQNPDLNFSAISVYFVDLDIEPCAEHWP